VLWKTDSVSAPCGRLPGEGIHSPNYYRWKRQLDRHGPEILTQSPYRNVPLPKIQREEMRFLTPAEIVDLAEAIHARYRTSCSSAPTAACGWASWPGSAKGRVDLLAGAVTVAEILTEVKGKLIAGPRHAPAGEPSGCRPSSSVSWRHILPPRSGPAATSSPPPVGGRCGFRAFERLLDTGDQGSRPAGPAHHDLRHTAVALWIGRRCDAQGGRRARGAHLGQLDLDRYGHQTIPGRSRRAIQ
jgi:hypothetical protein